MDVLFQLSVIGGFLGVNSWLICRQFRCLTYASRNAALQQIDMESNYDDENYGTTWRCSHASL